MNFDAWLRCLGLIPTDIIPGKWMRCSTESHPRKKNGSYKLAESGRIGWAIDFATMSEPETWRTEETSSFKNIPRPVIHDNRQRIDEENRASLAAMSYYAACKPLTDFHQYLLSKDLETPVTGLRIDPKGWLVVPMGRSIQRISPEGDKRFWPGAPTKGAVFQIARRGYSNTVLCEGLATGIRLFEAMPNSRVLVCFNAGNLPVVAKTIKQGMVVVASDNDHETEKKIGKNPGVQYATKAAEILGCGIAIPQCEGSDWDDWAQEKIAEKKAAMFRRQSISDIQRSVYSQMNLAVMRHAKMRFT